MDFKKSDLKLYGFQGFVPVSNFKTKGCDIIPKKKGIYIVIREDMENVTFLEQSIGGFFKDKCPTVPIGELKNNWIENACVLYIGKAGGAASAATLFSRIRQYVRFGMGAKVGHWGGRYIWQLKNSDSLLIAWKPLDQEEPHLIESYLIEKFANFYGKRPFANLMG